MKKDEKSGTNASTNVLGCFFHDSMVQSVALGRMLNMLTVEHEFSQTSCTCSIELG